MATGRNRDMSKEYLSTMVRIRTDVQGHIIVQFLNPSTGEYSQTPPGISERTSAEFWGGGSGGGGGGGGSGGGPPGGGDDDPGRKDEPDPRNRKEDPASSYQHDAPEPNQPDGPGGGWKIPDDWVPTGGEPTPVGGGEDDPENPTDAPVATGDDGGYYDPVDRPEQPVGTGTPPPIPEEEEVRDEEEGGRPLPGAFPEFGSEPEGYGGPPGGSNDNPPDWPGWREGAPKPPFWKNPEGEKEFDKRREGEVWEAIPGPGGGGEQEPAEWEEDEPTTTGVGPEPGRDLMKGMSFSVGSSGFSQPSVESQDEQALNRQRMDFLRAIEGPVDAEAISYTDTLGSPGDIGMQGQRGSQYIEGGAEIKGGIKSFANPMAAADHARKQNRRKALIDGIPRVSNRTDSGGGHGGPE